jgi:hypothetical protein
VNADQRRHADICWKIGTGAGLDADDRRWLLAVLTRHEVERLFFPSQRRGRHNENWRNFWMTMDKEIAGDSEKVIVARWRLPIGSRIAFSKWRAEVLSTIELSGREWCERALKSHRAAHVKQLKRDSLQTRRR